MISVILATVLSMVLGTVTGGACGYIAASWRMAQQRFDTSKGDQEATEPTKPDVTPDAIGETGKTVADIAKQCTPYVVNITTYVNEHNYTGGSSLEETVAGHGTGVIVRQDGYIVTCHHVIEDADSIKVFLHDDTEHDAELVGHDELFDLAVIRIDAAGLPAAAMGDSDAVATGAQVVAIGNPLGEFGSSVSAGVLSAPARELTVEGVPLRLMQTDAAVNPGNSGGGLFNMNGELIGIVNAKISASGIEGIAFAIPLNSVKSRVDSLITNGTTTQKAYLGVSTKNATLYLDGQEIKCVQIVSVRDGSPAEEAGLRVDDYLLSADGRKLKDNDALTLMVKYRAPGEQIEFTVHRDGDRMEIPVKLGTNES